jgi:hypothetical protein
LTESLPGDVTTGTWWKQVEKGIRLARVILLHAP